MGAEVRADPVEIAKLAQRTLTASIELGDGWAAAHPGLSVPVAAFGNLGAGQRLQRSQVAATEDADTAVGRLVAVYEGDVDRLYRVAFGYQQADREAAERNRRSRGGMRFE